MFANNYPKKSQKLFIDDQKKIFPYESIIILVSADKNKVSIIIGLTEDLTTIFDATELVKIASSIVGGKGGGGRKDLAQAGGNIIENANQIYEVLKNEIIKLM